MSAGAWEQLFDRVRLEHRMCGASRLWTLLSNRVGNTTWNDTAAHGNAISTVRVTESAVMMTMMLMLVMKMIMATLRIVIIFITRMIALFVQRCWRLP